MSKHFFGFGQTLKIGHGIWTSAIRCEDNRRRTRKYWQYMRSTLLGETFSDNLDSTFSRTTFSSTIFRISHFRFWFSQLNVRKGSAVSTSIWSQFTKQSPVLVKWCTLDLRFLIQWVVINKKDCRTFSVGKSGSS
jgi:hypothetical protein